MALLRKCMAAAALATIVGVVAWVGGVGRGLEPKGGEPLPAAAEESVVINEIFYHAPNDLEDVQWIELYNTTKRAMDLSSWGLDNGKLYTFPEGTTIAANGFLVVALNPEAFERSYGQPALGPFKRAIKKGSEKLVLVDGLKRRIDRVRYKDRDPWPVSPDGYSASLERICPTVSGDAAENWAASPLPEKGAKPSGTPGKQNATYSAAMLPSVQIVSDRPEDLGPEQALPVEAEVKGDGIQAVSLLYRVVAEGTEGPEATVAMTLDQASGHYEAAIPGQKAGAIIRYRVKAVTDKGVQRVCPAEQDMRPTYSTYVHEAWKPAQIPFACIIHVNPSAPKPTEGREAKERQPVRTARIGPPGVFGGPPDGDGGPGEPPGSGEGNEDERPARGTAAFVYFDPQAGKTWLFDYIHVIQRNGGFFPMGGSGGGRGYKVYFHKDRTLNGMSAVSVIFEGSERFLLAEALAYDVYRRAGNAACLTEFVRLWVDGRMAGYHLLIERPNSAFLRRNNVDDKGNLYKLTWMGQGIEGQHRKRTHTQSGHDDLVALIEQLEKTRGDEQWKVIEENFNVRQVATFFAVNMVLSHWDGYFNNHFVYHDTAGTKKWEMYPWDQDKTWGFYDGIGPGEVFFDMPLTFGMEGATPPGGRGGQDGGGFGMFGGGGPMWWRPGGYFSRPLLANKRFRAIFLERTRDILKTVYTPEAYDPLIDALAVRLKEDVGLRAKMEGREAEDGERLLEENVRALKTHVVKRREFLLGQAELRGGGKEGERG